MNVTPLITALLATVLVPATALAQPGQPPAPAPAEKPVPPPPQTHEWNQVSHINGNLIRVGEQVDYLNEFPRTNIQTNPLNWVFGSFGVSVTHAFHRHLAIGGHVDLVDDGSGQGANYGIAAPVYFRRAYSGLFLEPGIEVKTRKDYDTVGGPHVSIGYHWIWDGGLNTSIGFGVGKDTFGTDEEDHYEYDNDQYFRGYWRFGYAF